MLIKLSRYSKPCSFGGNSNGLELNNEGIPEDNYRTRPLVLYPIRMHHRELQTLIIYILLRLFRKNATLFYCKQKSSADPAINRQPSSPVRRLPQEMMKTCSKTLACIARTEKTMLLIM